MPILKTLVMLLIFNTAMADSDGIWVEGTGSSEAKPDIVTFSFVISTIDKSALKAQKENAKIADAVLNKLKSQSVAGKDIQTTSLNVMAEYDYQNRTRVLKGHRVQHSFVTTVRDVEKVGSIVDQLTSTGTEALSISGISFGLSKHDEFKLKALANAVEQAKTKAQVLAKAADKSLGKIVAIEELTGGMQQPVVRMEMMKMASADVSTPVESGEVGVSARVKVHFKLD